jgi:hypothetical protein
VARVCSRAAGLLRFLYGMAAMIQEARSTIIRVSPYHTIIGFTFDRFPMVYGSVRHRKFHGNCSATGIRA